MLRKTKNINSKTGITLKELLLYPTVSYANKDNYLDSFKELWKKFVNKYFHMLKVNPMKLNVLLTVEEVLKLPLSIDKFNNYIYELKNMY